MSSISLQIMDEAIIILGLVKLQSKASFVTMSPMPRKDTVVSIG